MLVCSSPMKKQPFPTPISVSNSLLAYHWLPDVSFHFPCIVPFTHSRQSVRFRHASPCIVPRLLDLGLIHSVLGHTPNHAIRFRPVSPCIVVLLTGDSLLALGLLHRELVTHHIIPLNLGLLHCALFPC